MAPCLNPVADGAQTRSDKTSTKTIWWPQRAAIELTEFMCAISLRASSVLGQLVGPLGCHRFRGFETPAGFDTFGLVENHGLVLVT